MIRVVLHYIQIHTLYIKFSLQFKAACPQARCVRRLMHLRLVFLSALHLQSLSVNVRNLSQTSLNDHWFTHACQTDGVQ